MMPGATSTSLSTATISHSRIVRPSGSVMSVPVIEIGQHLRGIEIVAGMVDGADHEIGAVMLVRTQDRAMGMGLGFGLGSRLERDGGDARGGAGGGEGGEDRSAGEVHGLKLLQMLRVCKMAKCLHFLHSSPRRRPGSSFGRLQSEAGFRPSPE